MYMENIKMCVQILICKFEHQFLLVGRCMEYLMNVTDVAYQVVFV